MARVSGRKKWIAGAIALLGALIAAVLWLVSRPAAPPSTAPTPDTAAANAAKPVGEKPHWADLKPAQQQALAPLQATWEELGPVRKQKWISIANRLAKMKPSEKARVQERMREWVALSPAERKAVRENFARAQKKATPPGQRTAEWEQYQQLPQEARKALADAAAAKRTQIAKPPTPAQAAVKTPAPVKAAGHGLVPAPGTVPPGTVPPAPIGLPPGSPAIVPPGSAQSVTPVAPAAPAPLASPAVPSTDAAAPLTVPPAAPVPNASK
ncbi:MAG: hypothetical protein K0R43_443 [Pseudoduganella sp.]|jgi:hypothetical protein|nr:hypothetical protein [Pseudoduganella sp.]